jgi:hypothetical protein
MLKIYKLPNHTITIGVCILEIQLSRLFLDRNGHCRGCLLIHRFLFYYYSDFYGFKTLLMRKAKQTVEFLVFFPT